MICCFGGRRFGGAVARSRTRARDRRVTRASLSLARSGAPLCAPRVRDCAAQVLVMTQMHTLAGFGYDGQDGLIKYRTELQQAMARGDAAAMAELSSVDKVRRAVAAGGEERMCFFACGSVGKV